MFKKTYCFEKRAVCGELRTKPKAYLSGKKSSLIDIKLHSVAIAFSMYVLSPANVLNIFHHQENISACEYLARFIQ